MQPPLHIVLYEPEIPPNTGNIIRLCANAGAQLHLIEPLGFDLSEKQLRRAGMDYIDWDTLHTHPSLAEWQACVTHHKLYALSTKATRCYTEASFQPGDALLFGPESRGLPEAVRHSLPEAQRLTIPMQSHSRSINLCNSVAITLYEAWRQLGFS